MTACHHSNGVESINSMVFRKGLTQSIVYGRLPISDFDSRPRVEGAYGPRAIRVVGLSCPPESDPMGSLLIGRRISPNPSTDPIIQCTQVMAETYLATNMGVEPMEGPCDV